MAITTDSTTYVADQRIECEWTQAHDRWLAQFAPATQRAYAAAYNDWRRNVQRPPWLATSADVVTWIEEMRGRGLAAASINQRLGAVSSLYAFVIRDRQMDDAGVERCLFTDARGNPRANPFRANSVRRARGRKVRDTRPLSKDQLRAMRDGINPDTRTGARDLALFECYLRTGRRLSEIARLRWSDIDPDSGTFEWSGKGGKQGRRTFPRVALAAVVAYLQADNRWPCDPQGYIFVALMDHGTRNFVPEGGAGGHLSPGQIGRVIKKIARHAGLGNDVHAHQLRHSFAFYLYEATKNPRLVQESLDHKYLTTTMVYLEGLGEPEDRVSEPLEAALGF